MAKSKRVLGAVLAVIMVFTMIPMGIIGSASAVGDEITTASLTDKGDGGLVVPQVTLTSTNVIRVASGIGAYTPGNTIVAATPSGLPQVTSDYAAQYYCDETPVSPTVVFTTDKELAATPTIACENSAGVTFSAPVRSGNTYTWTITSGTDVAVGALKFVVGYSYSYTDSLTGKVVTKNYKAFATSYVEYITQPGGMYAYRERKAPDSFHERERTRFVTRILSANSYGSYYAYNDTTGGGNWKHGYYDFTTREFVNVSDSSNGAKGYGMTYFSDTGTPNTGIIYTNTGVDQNRAVTTIYVDRSMGESLSTYNARITVAESYKDNKNYKFYTHYDNWKIIPGESEYSETSASNNVARTQLGISTDFAGSVEIAKSSYINVPMKGNTYRDAATLQENGNYLSAYTIVVEFGTVCGKTGRRCRVNIGVDLRIASYDKSELRGYIKELLTENDPTTPYAADSEIGIYPQEEFYSAGWNEYKAALQNAQALINKPDTNQNEINVTLAALETAVEGLVVKEADYTLVDTAMEQISKLNPEHYTEESWRVLAEAVKNKKDGYSVFYQSAVDKMAADINAAILGLEFGPADYTTVDEVIAIYESLNPTDYTPESWANLKKAVDDVQWNLTIDKQALVDAYAAAIGKAIDDLKYGLADYTECKELETKYKELAANKDLYTEISWRRATAAYNDIDWTLDWRYQEDVNDYAAALDSAIKRLEFKDADYSRVDAAIDAADAINPDYYTAKSYQALMDAVDAVEYDLDINEQERVTAMAVAIENAINKLVDLDGDYDPVYEAIDKADALNKFNYTPESWAEVEAAINAVDWDLPKKDEAKIQAYADAINKAIGELVEVGADYTTVNEAITRWNNFPNKENYTLASVMAVNNLINNVDWDLPISKQEEVFAMAKAINDAIDNLSLKPANYDRVDAALANAKAYTDKQAEFAAKYNGYSYYVPSLYDSLTTAIGNVVRGLDYTHQDEVYAMADAISDAVSALKANKAYYGDVDAALAKEPADLTQYTKESVAVLTVAKLSVDRDLTTEDQALVDEMAQDIEDAISGLIPLPKDADYRAVDKAIADAKEAIKNTNYTEESVKAVNDAINAVVRGLKEGDQAKVDKMAADIIEAMNNLKNKPLDTSKFDEAVTKIPENLDDYTDETVAAVNDAKKAAEEFAAANDISKQTEYDALVDALIEAIENLETKVVLVERFEAKPGSTTVIDGKNYIYGLEQKLTKANFEEKFVEFENVRLEYEYANSRFFLGTGSTVTVISELTGEVMGVYTIVIFGDVDGDGQIKVNDATQIAGSFDGSVDTLEGANKMAANVDGNKIVNRNDSTALFDAISQSNEIDQVTGKIIKN